MPEKIIGQFSVKQVQVLNENGEVDLELMPRISDNQLIEMYKAMVLTRVFDDKAFKLQRQGRMGTYAQCLGQEASQIGAAFALNAGDWVFPTYRSHGLQIARGMPMYMILQYYGGDERGQRIPDGINNFTIAIPVGSQPLHAVGCAYGAKIRKQKIAALALFGDGASSTGDTQIAMNFAGTFQLPVVFLCENNQYAISVPRKTQTKAETIAQKAIAYGFEGIQVDGNDALAVYKVVKEALEKARKGEGATLVECLTYRMGEHTTADDWTKYRSKEEVESWKKKDPIERMKKLLIIKGIWNEKFEEEILKEAIEKVEDNVKAFESIPLAEKGEFFDYMYEKIPESLREQKEYFLKL